MTTFADLTRKTARLVTRTVLGSTTSAPGNGTQVIDTVNLAGYPDNQFAGGTVWITSGANAGKSRAITGFLDSADRITCAAFPSNIEAGVTFEAAPSDYVTYMDLRQAVNNAILEAGKIIGIDETTLAVESDTIYTLPAGVHHVVGVEAVEDIGTVDESRKINTHWEERDGKLYFDEGRAPTADLTIRILYEKLHTELYNDTDALSTQLDEEYLVYLAARQAMRLVYKRFGKAGSDTIPEWLNEAAEEALKHVHRNEGTPRVMVRTA